MSFKDPNENKVINVVTYSNADFKLAPDIIVVKKVKYIYEGASMQREHIYVLLPKNINSKDMEMIMKFFSFSMIKMIAQALGIKLRTLVLSKNLIVFMLLLEK